MNYGKKSVHEGLGLPPMPDNEEEFSTEDDESELYQFQEDIMNMDSEDIEKLKKSMSELKEYRTQLKDIPDITNRKEHLNRLAAMAEEKFSDIFDRGFNCEDRFMAEIIKGANELLKIAIDAHSKVIDSDIKLIDMQLKKDKMEFDMNKKVPQKSTESEKDVTPQGKGYNRNELLFKNK